MIKKGDVCAGVKMLLQKLIIILGVDHVVRSDDDIVLMHSLDNIKVFGICMNVRIIDRIMDIEVCKQHLQFALFGVDVVVTAGSQMLGE